jgi:hypothetical protein
VLGRVLAFHVSFALSARKTAQVLRQVLGVPLSYKSVLNYAQGGRLPRPRLQPPPQSNRAEGCGRNGDAELARFCSIALGSARELDYRLLLARNLKLINPKDYREVAQRTSEVKRMLSGLLGKLNAERSDGQDFKYLWLFLVRGWRR